MDVSFLYLFINKQEFLVIKFLYIVKKIIYINIVATTKGKLGS